MSPKIKQNRLKQIENNKIKEESFLNYTTIIKKMFAVVFFLIFDQINLLNILKNVFVLFWSLSLLAIISTKGMSAFILGRQHQGFWEDHAYPPPPRTHKLKLKHYCFSCSRAVSPLVPVCDMCLCVWYQISLVEKNISSVRPQWTVTL